MKVTLWVDALGPNPGGIGRYTWELSRGLPAIPDLEVSFYGRGRIIEDPAALMQAAPVPRRPRGLRKVGAWWDCRKLKGGLVHGPNYFLPDFAAHGIITVHDLSVFRYPDTHPAERVEQFERQFADSLGRASAIITDTETVRQELIADFGLEPGRITAIHLGVDTKFHPRAATECAGQLATLGVARGRYALCVSTLEPRKKIAELLDCWRRLPTRLREAYPLVLAGGAGWRNERLQGAIEDGQRDGWLRYLGFVDERLLPALYAGARLFLDPSLYEGFGLPPLEAMASGSPTIVAARSCLPEVCGEAVRYIDPENPDDMFDRIAHSLADEAWLRDAAARGPLQASKFRWDRCINETAALYRAVGSANGC